MKSLFQHPLVLSLLLVGGCASQTGHHKVLAKAQPLQVCEVSSEAKNVSNVRFFRSPRGKLQVEGPKVAGTRGQGLNVATSVHRILLAMGISTEVTIQQLNRSQSQVQIAFPQELSPVQRSQVKRVLQLIRN